MDEVGRRVLCVLGVNVRYAVRNITGRNMVRACIVLNDYLPFRIEIDRLYNAVAEERNAEALRRRVMYYENCAVWSMVRCVGAGLYVIISDLIAYLAPERSRLNVVRPVLLRRVERSRTR